MGAMREQYTRSGGDHASGTTGAGGAEGLAPGKRTLVEQVQAAPGGNAGRATLHVGSSGPDVEALQQQLTAAGHPCEVDGKFGSQTRAAVVAFQRGRGLAADGVVGQMTWQALGGGGATPETPAPAPAPGPTPDGGAAGTKDAATGGDGGPGAGAGAGTGEQASSGSAVRDAIVAAARGKIGTVFSDVPGPADETGDKVRTGWETLTEFFALAHPTFPKQIIKYIKYGKNNGGPESKPNGLVSWCGIFATWAVMTGGGNCGTWTSGSRCSAMSKVTRDPKPGDVGYFESKAHHCIIAQVNGDQIETIDGNSFDGSGGGNGAITSRWRSRSDFALFFKQVDD